VSLESMKASMPARDLRTGASEADEGLERTTRGPGEPMATLLRVRAIPHGRRAGPETVPEPLGRSPDRR